MVGIPILEEMDPRLRGDDNNFLLMRPVLVKFLSNHFEVHVENVHEFIYWKRSILVGIDLNHRNRPLYLEGLKLMYEFCGPEGEKCAFPDGDLLAPLKTQVKKGSQEIPKQVKDLLDETKQLGEKALQWLQKLENSKKTDRRSEPRRLC